MRLVPPQGGETCAKIKPDVKFENPNNSYVKFCPGIEKKDEKMQESIQDEVSTPHKGIKNLMVRFFMHHTVSFPAPSIDSPNETLRCKLLAFSFSFSLLQEWNIQNIN